MNRLQNKVAIITGAAQGFGEGIAEHMHAEGATVVIADINGALAETVANRLGDRAAHIQVDVGDEESVRSMAHTVAERFGGIDILVSNAGILRAGGLDEMDYDTFRLVTKINYDAFYLCAKHVSAIMKESYNKDNSRFFDIIQINSKSGLSGSAKNFAYSGSKFGSIGLVESFALELVQYNIKVNAVCPGNFYEGPLWSDPVNGLFVQYLKAGKVPGAKTVEDVAAFYMSKVPMRRGCYPQDVARAIFYLVEQQYETGQALPVTGGQMI